MQFFRRMMQSKFGGYIALALLAMLAFAFVAGDMTGSGGLGSIGGANPTTVAEVGGHNITVNDLQVSVRRFYEQAQRQNPALTMDEFLKQGAVKQTLDSLVAIKALIAYGDKHGMRISKKLVDAEIARMPVFADATGAFSEAQFRAALKERGISEKELREDFTGQIIRNQLLQPATLATRTPEGMVPPYSAMLIELREGHMFSIPSQRFAPTRAPSEAELKAYYAANPADFSLPEQRKLRYALISRSSFDAQATPTDKDIADAYKAAAAQYAAREARSFSQLILPTEKQGRDMAAKANGGKTLVDLAREVGLTASRLDGLDQNALAGQTSAEAAKAAFAASKGQLIGPVRTPLGWALIRVEDVRTIAGKTLEQAKAELAPQLRTQKAKELFADFVNKLDGKLGDGATLAELATANKLQIVETPALTADGRNLRDQAFKPDAVATALLKPAFSMGPTDDPQVVTVVPDEQVAILAPDSNAIAAGPPPLAEVRTAAEFGWRLSQGAAKARDAANKVVQLLNKGVAAEEALKQAGASGLPSQPISFRRIQLSQQQGPVPPQLLALLTMRVNSAKLVAMNKNLGFVVVQLNKITPQDPRSDLALMQSTRAGLANVLGGEYMLQLTSAIERDLKVTRNPAAIASVEKALRGDTGAAQ